MLRHASEKISHTEPMLPQYDEEEKQHGKMMTINSSNDVINLVKKSYMYLLIGVLVLFAYSVGYSNGSLQIQIQTDNDANVEKVNLRNIAAIEHMQGYSEAYPNYDESPETEEKVVEDDEETDEVYDEQQVELAREKEEVKILTSSAHESEIYENFDDYKAAPWVTVPNIDTKYDLPFNLPKKNLWWSTKLYETHYRRHPIKKLIPRLKRNVQLTVDEFHTRFRKPAQPVVFNFENLRSLGFQTQNYTIQDLKLMFPYDEARSTSKVQQQFVANGIRKVEDELDIGPGLVAIEKDEELFKQGKLRSFPRNLKVKLDAIKKLNVQRPPLLKNDDDTLWQLPTFWMGTSSSDTRFHHDCCDNFVMMISGTKRFTLAPTSDWRILNPECIGKNKALCWANVNDPNQRVPGANKKGTEASLKYMNKMIVDVGPGDILYMPAGWFHHIQNLGPTVMVNWWTKGTETCALSRSLKNPNY